MIDWIADHRFGLFFTLVVTTPFWVGGLGFLFSQWREHRRNRLRTHELSNEEYCKLAQIKMQKGRRP